MSMAFNVELPCGTQLGLSMDNDSSIKDIKKAIISKSSDLGNFRLRLGQAWLKDADTLEGRGIEPGTILHVKKNAGGNDEYQARRRLARGTTRHSRAHKILNAVKSDTTDIKQDTKALRDYFSTELPDDCSRSEAIRRVQRERDVANWKLRELKQLPDAKAPKAIIAGATDKFAEQSEQTEQAKQKKRRINTEPAEITEAKQKVDELQKQFTEAENNMKDLKARYHAAQNGSAECDALQQQYIDATSKFKDIKKKRTEANKALQSARKAAKSASASSATPLKRPAAARKPASRNQRLADGSVPAGAGTGGSSSSAAPEAASEDAVDAE